MRPFSPDSPETRIAGLRRDVETVKRRSAGPWRNVGDPGQPAFQNSWTNVGSGLTQMRFRLLEGGGVEIQGSVMGGANGTVVFTLPTEYQPDSELRLAASDDAGAFVLFRVLADGSVIFGLT